ncbi:MAG TPA: glutaredoxin 3 [Candidatus Nitrosotenuis sp.]|nr:glutaredoxin 3 [Candidatus Nitrosotenuis sp.]
MTKVVIYTTPICPYCDRAKDLLTKKGVTYQEIDVSENSLKREEMSTKSGGRRTVPQIFINDAHIGGFDDLYELDRQGKLDSLLKEK